MAPKCTTRSQVVALEKSMLRALTGHEEALDAHERALGHSETLEFAKLALRLYRSHLSALAAFAEAGDKS